MNLPPKALSRHREQGQLPTSCNRIYNTGESVNVVMRPTEAMQVATNILTKVRLLMDEGLSDEWAIQLWSAGNGKLRFGLKPAVKERRVRS